MLNDGVGPVKQFFSISIRDTEQLADHLDGESSGNRLDKVDLVAEERPVDVFRD